VQWKNLFTSDIFDDFCGSTGADSYSAVEGNIFHLFDGECVEVSGIAHETIVPEGFEDGVAETQNTRSFFAVAHPVRDFGEFGGGAGFGAAAIGDSSFFAAKDAGGWFAAGRATGRFGDGRVREIGWNTADNFRNNIASEYDFDFVADTDLEAVDFVPVIQKGVFDVDAAYADLFEDGCRDDGSGVSHGQINTQKNSGIGFVGKLYRSTIFWSELAFGIGSDEFVLVLVVVETDYHSVDFEGELFASIGCGVVEFVDDVGGRAHEVGDYVEPQLGEGIEFFLFCGEFDAYEVEGDEADFVAVVSVVASEDAVADVAGVADEFWVDLVEGDSVFLFADVVEVFFVEDCFAAYADGD